DRTTGPTVRSPEPRAKNWRPGGRKSSTVGRPCHNALRGPWRNALRGPRHNLADEGVQQKEWPPTSLPHPVGRGGTQGRIERSPNCRPDTNPVSSSADAPLEHVEQRTMLGERLSAHLARFMDAWAQGKDAPALTAFLAAEPPGLRRLGLIELIKLDME